MGLLVSDSKDRHQALGSLQGTTLTMLYVLRIPSNGIEQRH